MPMNSSIVVPCDGEYRALGSGSPITTIESVGPEPAGSAETGGGRVSSGVSVVGVGSVIGVITSGAGSVGGAVAAGSVVVVGSVTGVIGSGAGVGSVGVAVGSVVGVGSVGSVVGVASTGSVPAEVSTGSVAVEVPSSAMVPTDSPLPASEEATSSVVAVVSATVAVVPTSSADSARASAAKPKIQRTATLNATVVQRPSLGTLTPLAASRETDAKLGNRSFPRP
jgi:hypothetical protein